MLGLKIIYSFFNLKCLRLKILLFGLKYYIYSFFNSKCLILKIENITFWFKRIRKNVNSKVNSVFNS